MAATQKKKKEVSEERIEFSITPVFTVDGPVTIKELTTRYITWVVALCDGDRHEAARVMGVTSRTIYNYINKEQNV